MFWLILFEALVGIAVSDVFAQRPGAVGLERRADTADPPR
jgi:hypothetical protein